MDVRRTLRAAALAGSYRLGVPRVSDAIGAARTVVLMYHGIAADDRRAGIENWYGYNVPLAQFTAQMEYLARRCDTVALDDAVAGRRPARGRVRVVLTFDDGYESNYVHAFPVLRRLGLPATFAIATGFVTERRPLWNDVLEFAVGHAPARRGVLAWDKTPIPYDTETLDGRLALFRALWAHGVEVDQLRRDALVSAAAAQLDVAVDASDVFRHPGYRPLHAGQIRDMADSGLAQFCSHSVHHYVLPRLSSAARRAELGRSKDDVEKLSGRPCTALCLPGGFHDRASLDDAFATGFTRVLTSDRRDADPSEPVMGRYVVVRSHTAAELAELVHAPLRRMAGWIRRRGAAAR